MSNNEQQFLGRPIQAVKRLSKDVTLDNYFKDIRPFLFGTDNDFTITEDTVPNKGIHNKVNGKELLAGTTRDTLISIQGIGKTLLQRANINDANFIKSLSDEKLASIYLFPSDLVSILTSLAKIFYSKGYGKTVLQKFGSSESYLSLIIKWGKPQTIKDEATKTEEDIILESNFFTGTSSVESLLKAVVQAAYEYEAAHAIIDHSKFITTSELKTELTKKITSKILLEFKEYQEKIKDKTDKKFIEAHKKIIKFINDEIVRDFSFFNSLLTLKNLDLFSTFPNVIYYKEQKTYKFADDKIGHGILGTQEYINFEEISSTQFLERHKDYLIREFIDPLFIEEVSDTVPVVGEEDSDEPDEGGEVDTQNESSFTIIQTDFEKKAINDLSLLLIRNFINQIDNDRFEPFKATYFENNTIKEHRDSFLELLTLYSTNYVSSSSFLSNTIIDQLKDNNIIDSSGLFIDSVFSSDWYLEYLQTSLQSLISNQGNEFFDKLFFENILPILDTLDHRSDQTDSSDTSKATSQAVVPAIDQFGQPTQKHDPLDRKQQQKIQYEVGWLYNRAVYEMFTAYGLDTNEVNPKLLENLRNDIYQFTQEMDQKSLALMFGSASKRQEALLRFYPKFGNKNSSELAFFYQETLQNSNYQSLNDKQRNNFREFHSNLISGQVTKIMEPTELLRESLENVLKNDSPVLNKNIQNTLDSLILKYGKQQDFFTVNNNGELVVLDKLESNTEAILLDMETKINKMSSNELSLIFGISSSIIINDELIDKLRQTLLSYSTYRASEITLSIQNDFISNKLILDNSNASDLESNSNIRHLEFISGTREAIEKHGAETVANAMNSSKDSKRKKTDKIAKKYKTFIPLWNDLTPKEQRHIYKKYNIEFDKNANQDTELGFIPEFLFFDISSLKDFNKVKRNKDNQAKYQQFVKENQEYLVAVGEQIQKEEAYARYLRDYYIYSTKMEQALLIADYLMSQSENGLLEAYPDSSFFDNYSVSEIMSADQYINDTGYSISEGNSHLTKYQNLFGEIQNSSGYKKIKNKFGKYAKKKLDPSKKLAKALSKSAKEKAFKKLASSGINAALSGTGVGAALAGANWLASKIGYKNTLRILGLLLSIIIGKTLYALTTLGGFIGGVIGGVIGGLVSGGAMIIPGVIVGANVGQAIMPRNMIGAISGNNASASMSQGQATANAAIQNSAVNSAVLRKGVAAKTITSAGSFAGLSIGILAPGLSIILVIFASIYTVVTIQSAFLIPLPDSFGSERGGGEGSPIGDIACFKFAPAGTSKTIGDPPKPITSIDWDQSSIDLFESGLQTVSSNPQYTSLLCDYGPITVYKYPKSTQGYWGWVMNPNEMGLYEGAFSAGSKGMEYILIHESGHLLDGRNPGLRNSFMQNRSPGGECFTYPFPENCWDNEAFAEGVVLYVTSDRFFGNGAWSGPYPFKSKYSLEYAWFRDNVFNGIEY